MSGLPDPQYCIRWWETSLELDYLEEKKAEMTTVPLQSKVLSEKRATFRRFASRARRGEQRPLHLPCRAYPKFREDDTLERNVGGFSPRNPCAWDSTLGDIQTESGDAERLARFGFPVKGRLPPEATATLMAEQPSSRALEAWPLEQLDLLLVERCGNLVCPSSDELGEASKVVV